MALGAIEAGGTKFVCAISQGDGAIAARARIATRGPVETLAEVRDFFASAASAHGHLEGIGIASFGPIQIDPAAKDFGRFLNTPKPGWSGASYVDALRPLDAPIALDTDVNAAALGEWRRGAGRGFRTIAYTTIGTGIGSGVVHDGQCLAGFSHYETGHIRPARLAGDTFPGVCPFHGDCLEGLAGGPAILKRWDADLSESPEPDRIEMIAAYAAQLATCLVLTHMPERQIFGGGVCKAPGFLDALRKATRASLSGYIASLDRDLSEHIVGPTLGDDAGITGALELAARASAVAAQ